MNLITGPTLHPIEKASATMWGFTDILCLAAGHGKSERRAGATVDHDLHQAESQDNKSSDFVRLNLAANSQLVVACQVAGAFHRLMARINAHQLLQKSSIELSPTADNLCH